MESCWAGHVTQKRDALTMRWKIASAKAAAWNVASRKTWTFVVVVAVVHQTDQVADHDTSETALEE
jgi:hypothetical protein